MDVEKEPGCATCKDNRLLVEKAWQIIANEYYDQHDRFSQADWARQLLEALEVLSEKLLVNLLVCEKDCNLAPAVL